MSPYILLCGGRSTHPGDLPVGEVGELTVPLVLASRVG